MNQPFFVRDFSLNCYIFILIKELKRACSMSVKKKVFSDELATVKFKKKSFYFQDSTDISLSRNW